MDDDTYVIMENIRYAVMNFDPNEPLWMGRHFRPYNPDGYMSGGAGYLLSRKAVEKFVVEALHLPKDCKVKEDTGVEDGEMGKCLHAVGVKVADSRDNEGRQRFFPMSIDSHLNDQYGEKHWIWKIEWHPLQTGPACCGDYAATFHYATPGDMVTFECESHDVFLINFNKLLLFNRFGLPSETIWSNDRLYL